MHRADLTKLGVISEVHFADLMGEAMRRFVRKYQSMTGEHDGYFVNFNPKAADTRDKTIVGYLSRGHKATPHPQLNLPDHSDPVGVYAYPIDYVIDHWHDLAYGSDMGYLRVLKQKVGQDKVLRLDHMTKEKFLSYMAKLRMEWEIGANGSQRLKSWNEADAMRVFDAVSHYNISSHEHHRINTYGKTLYNLIQCGYKFYPNRQDPRDEDLELGGSFKYKGEFKAQANENRNQAKQNRILTRAGFAMLVDYAETPADATIYDQEPEQVVFLTKDAFEIEEVIKLSTGEATRSIKNEEPDIKGPPKVAGMVARAIGDVIAQKVPVNLMGRGGVKNLGALRVWLGTGQIEDQNAALDVTETNTVDIVHGFITKRGRLICVGFVKNRHQKVRDPGAEEQTGELAYNQALIRPGEEDQEEDINASILSWVDNMEKRGHRQYPSHSANETLVSIVGEPIQVVGVYGKADQTFDEVAQDAADTFNRRRGASGSLKWQPINVDLLRRYADARRGGKPAPSASSMLAKYLADKKAKSAAGPAPAASP